MTPKSISFLKASMREDLVILDEKNDNNLSLISPSVLLLFFILRKFYGEFAYEILHDVLPLHWCVMIYLKR